MKKELLRIFNLTCRYGEGKKLENVSLLVVEGDRIGFYGLSQSGKDFLLSLISGKEDLEVRNCNVYLCGEKVTDKRRLKSFFHWMTSVHEHGSWTVAEYLFLKESGWLRMKRQEEMLFSVAGERLEELNIDIDVSRKISELSELEKRVIEIVRAYYSRACIVIIEDEFEGMFREEIMRFSRILSRIQEETGIAVIVNSHSEVVMSVLAKQCIIFKNGEIVKKGYRGNRMGSLQAEKYLLGKTMSSRKKSLEAYSRELEQNVDKSDEIVYSVEYCRRKDGKKIKFDFRKGKITTLLLSRNEEKEKLFEILAGWEEECGAVRRIGGKEFWGSGIRNMMRHRIVGIKYLGGKEEMFFNMTLSDNLLLPSLRKISQLQYIFNSVGLMRSVSAARPETGLDLKQKVSALETDDRIAALLERWYIYNPRVLILLEPFVNCDIYGVSVVENYLRKFTSRATAIVILKSREEYIEELSDEIIFCE